MFAAGAHTRPVGGSRPYADTALAGRVERSIARDLERYAQACARLDVSLDVAVERIGGGLAVFVTPGSPVNMAFAVGIDTPVTSADIARIEEFYVARGTTGAMSLSPFADESLLAVLAARGWLLADFENLMARRLTQDAGAQAAAANGVEVAVAQGETARASWGALSSAAYAEPEAPTREDARIGEAMAAREDCVLLAGLVGGEPAGSGALWVDDGLGWLVGDATLARFRGRGVHSALISARCALAAKAGCELALAEVRPGSTSQRNLERLGFSVLYTRVEMIAPPLRR